MSSASEPSQDSLKDIIVSSSQFEGRHPISPLEAQRDLGSPVPNHPALMTHPLATFGHLCHLLPAVKASAEINLTMLSDQKIIQNIS